MEARNIRPCIAIVFWSVYVSAAPLVSGDNLSGEWRLEGNELRWSAYEAYVEYDSEGSIIGTHDGFVDRPGRGYFESQGRAVQSETTIEGYGTGRSLCGEVLQVTVTGSISSDNRVEFTFTVPGGNELCYYPDGGCTYYSYTEALESYDGIYDSTNRVVTGTFKMNRERLYQEWWRHDKHWSVESTNIVQSGTFTVTICCSDGEFWPWEEVTFKGTQVLEAESGERIEKDRVGDYIELRYWRPGATEGYRIGICPFEGGCNNVYVYAPNMNKNSEPDCFGSIEWVSRDYARDDCNDGDLDVFHFKYVASSCQDKLSIWQEKRTYRPPKDDCGPPVSEPGTDTPCKTFCTPCWVKGTERIYRWWAQDRPLGNDTDEIFEKILEKYRKCPKDPNTMIGFLSLEPCDMDWDGDCDMEDCLIINSALDKCWEEQGYFPSADIDGDGCVTTLDIELMLGPRHPDVNGDGVVNLTDFSMFAAHWSPGAQGDWCGIGDFDISCAVDFADLLVLADHWLEESP